MTAILCYFHNTICSQGYLGWFSISIVALSNKVTLMIGELAIRSAEKADSDKFLYR